MPVFSRQSCALVTGAVFLSLACSGTAKPTPGAAPPAPERGRSLEDPVLTCGPKESYAYVARFRCPDGKAPLGGDLQRGAQARLGSSVSAKTSHHVDRYQVPCAGGPVTLYVDLYGCPEQAESLAQVQEGTAEGRALTQAFEDGEYARVRERCEALGQSAAADERAWCLALVPASLHIEKRDEEAFATTARICSAFPPASEASQARATQVALLIAVLGTASRSGRYPATKAEQEQLIARWLSICAVPPAQLEQVLNEMQRATP